MVHSNFNGNDVGSGFVYAASGQAGELAQRAAESAAARFGLDLPKLIAERAALTDYGSEPQFKTKPLSCGQILCTTMKPIPGSDITAVTLNQEGVIQDYYRGAEKLNTAAGDLNRVAFDQALQSAKEAGRVGAASSR